MRRKKRKWRLILPVLVGVLFVQSNRGEALLDSFDWRAVHRVVGSAHIDEARESPLGLQMVGQVGGRTEDVAVQGDYAYVGVGLRLVVLDVSQPITPTEVGSTTPFPEFAEGVTISGTVAYVAAGMGGLRVVDVSDPINPVETGLYDTPGYAESVAVAGSHAYVADGHYGLRVVDVADPSAPVEVGYAYPLNYVFDVVVEGAYIYLAAAGAGLLVVDISDPAHPTELSSLDTPGYAYGVDVADGVAYVADGWEHLRVVDVSDPAHPVETASYETPGWSFDVQAAGGRLYVADAFAGLQVLDVSDPANPATLGGEEVSRGHAGSVVVVGSTAYVADRNRGLRVLDVSAPKRPSQVGFYGPMDYAAAVAVSGDYAHVAAGAYGLRVVDISDPAQPKEVGAYDTQGNAIGVAVGAGYAYVAVTCPKTGAGLHVVDVSEPERPTRAGYLHEVEGCLRDIALAGGVVYLANEWGLELVDVSSPSEPALAGYIVLMGEEWAANSGVDVSGELVFVAQAEAGLKIVDATNPRSPTLLGTFKDPDWVKGYGVAASATTAYVTHHGADDLKIVDVADPLHPTLLGAYWGGGAAAERVIVDGSTAFVAFGSGGLHGVDVSDPAHPRLALWHDTPGHAIAVAVQGDYLYVADGNGGVVILEIGEVEARASVAMPSDRTARVTAPLSIGPTRQPTFSFSGGSSLLWRSGEKSVEERLSLVRQQPATGSTPGFQTAAGTCVVTSAADSGPGTLRTCMDGLSTGAGITFDASVFPPANPVTITLESDLPSIWHGQVTIDASNAGVILDGNQIEHGTAFSLSSSHNTIRGLQIIRFSNAGVLMDENAAHNIIGGDRTVGDGPMGQGNLISGNGMGVGLDGSNNSILGNFIGTDVTGTRAFGNRAGGVEIAYGSGNRIGAPAPGERNIISANGGTGVHLVVGASGNIIENNYVGTDVHGETDLGNGWTGILLELGCPHNTVRGNLVSGSNWGGVVLADLGSDYNTVVGNLIGTDASGTEALGNRWCGVATGERFNRIGGTSPADRNVISGNPQGFAFGGGEHNLVLGSFIGTDIRGTASIPNKVGISLLGGSSRTHIGGSTTAERNVISGNSTSGIVLGGTDSIFILGNYVGTSRDGLSPLPNGQPGIHVAASEHTVVQGNLIAGNRDLGVSIADGSGITHVRANRIGVAADGVSPLPNGIAGVNIEKASSNLIGGLYPEDGNVIAFNDGTGVEIWAGSRNTIRRNSVYGNAGRGIGLGGGGNDELPAPIITYAFAGSVSGTACPGCIVELFSDEEDEGRLYEGYAIADGSGDWVWMGSPNGPHVTATATDEAGNTSAFSAPRMVWRYWIYLPLVLKGSH